MEIGTSGYISADGHVVEPADLWTTRMDKRFRDRAPRVESRPEADYYIIEGLTEFPVGLEGVTIEEKIQGQVTTPKGRRHAETRPGAWDPQPRLVDQERDHLRAEVIYPGGFGLQFFHVQDAEYQREIIRVYNDWISEFCSAAPDRLLGSALLPMRGPVEWAVEEAERIAGMKGIRTILIPAEVERSYAHSDYNPMWDALQDIGLPVSTHSGTGTGEAIFAKIERLGTGLGVTDNKVLQPMRAMADLIWGAVPQRYPQLRFVVVEGGIGWVASLLGFMDHWWNDHRHWMEPQLDEAPSTYFKRQFWATFEDDRAGILTRELVGVDRLMWGSDYPHTEGTFPYSQEQIMRDFMGVPEAEVYQMVTGNAAQLYGLAEQETS
ncbi:MAG: amidohydrolase family protein [Desulfurellaceae bacterium]|nr:amidohydrolase family protein [Desulfurellaceae bacterium]